MQGGAFSTSGVLSYSTRVLVNGVPRPVEGWSVDRDLAMSGGRLVAGDGVSPATGSVRWARGAVAAGLPLDSPWGGGWTPSPGDRVVVLQGDGVSEWVQFTGVIDSTTGDLDGSFESKIVDDYDRLSAQVRQPALLAVMPPHAPGGAHRGTGLVHTYYVDLAMRAGGFFTTPPSEPGAVVHIPCQGGTWPHVGEPVTATATGASYPANRWAPWGFAVSGFQHTYVPESPLPASAAVQMSVLVGPDHAGFFYTRIAYGSGYIQLSVNNSRWVSVQYSGTVIASFTLDAAPSGAIVQAVVRGGQAFLRATTGQSATGATTFGGSALMGVITISGDTGARVAGIQVSHPTVAQEFRSQTFTPTARINTSNTLLMGVPEAIPAIDMRAASLLDEISKATFSFCWIDELGVLQWWPAEARMSLPPATAIQTGLDVISGGWVDSLQDTASRVSVKFKDPLVRTSSTQSIELWRGNGSEMGPLEERETPIGPGADQAWIGVDYTPTQVSPANWSPVNSNGGTVAGGYFALDGEEYPYGGVYYSVGMWRAGLTNYWIRETTSDLPAGVVHVPKTSPDSPAVYSRYRNTDLPVVRGHTLVEWTDDEYAPTQVGGAGPEYVHDGGPWVTPNGVERWGQFLISQMGHPRPSLTSLGVIQNPRRQLGDVITLQADSLLGVRFVGIVSRISSSHGPDGASCDIDVRVLGVDISQHTYAEFDQSLAAGLTYQQLQALGPVPQTYAEFNEEA